jgi:hypothetical protein
LNHEDNGAINFMEVVGVPESNQNNVDSPAYDCSGGPAPATTPAPTPVAVPATPAPVAGVCSTDACSNNSDCCSNVCNTRRNKCRK